MNRYVIILLCFALVLCALLYNAKKPSVVVHKDASKVTPVVNSSNINTANFASTISTIGMVNTLTATNLDQWRIMIKGLHKTFGFKISEYWHMGDFTNLLSSTPIMLQTNSKTVIFNANFINLGVRNKTNIFEADLHSPMLDIDETKSIGLQLCDLFGFKSDGFVAWCNKTGNHWMDAPLVGVGDLNHNFHVRNSFDNQKPWYIDLVINNP
ncbi:MAG TPA: hypothetical protein VGN23_12830 [Verrucomicrobiae bacterium]|jgi:hypothetical protein